MPPKKRKQATPEQRQKVFELKALEWSGRTIAAAVSISESGVRYNLENFTPGSTAAAARPGRPSKITPRYAQQSV